MDELEEFRTIFFQECNELLGALEEALSEIESGHADSDNINAAFRAIHSIKGGAGAFGFDGMVSFCHNLESVLDKLRNDQIVLSHDLARLLLRSKDIVADLVDAAQSDRGGLENMGTDVLAELKHVLDHGEAPSGSVAPAAPAPALVVEQAPAPKSDDAQNAVEENDEEEEEETASEREVIIHFKPEPDLIRAAIDPLKLFRDLQALGCVNVSLEKESIPSLDSYKTDKCYAEWKVSLFTAASNEDIEDIFFFAKEYASVTFEYCAIEECSTPVQSAEGAQSKAPASVEQKVEAAVSKASADIKAESGKEADVVAEGAAGKGGKAPITLRVDLGRIDRLVNMVGETVITQSVLAQQASALSPEHHGGLLHAIEALSRQTRELQESVMSIRAQPVKNVFQRMNRLVRELNGALGKDVKLVLHGEQTEVDTTVIEELSDPLVHMIRNSMDHGIEGPAEREAAGKPREGSIKLSADHRSSRIVITITDDGRGINREKVFEKAVERGLFPADAKLTPEEIENIIFMPGFSTADAISNVSGRGVGMDVVRRNIQALGGRVFISSTPGKGTVFTMTLPLTLAVLDGMVIKVGKENFIIPITSIIEASRTDSHQISIMPNGTRVINMRGEYVRLINLGNALGEPLCEKNCQVLIVETEAYGQVGMLVDDLIGQQQIVIKSLETNYKRVDGISGATILGDGKVALILDVDTLAQMNLGSNSYGAFNGFSETVPAEDDSAEAA